MSRLSLTLLAWATVNIAACDFDLVEVDASRGASLVVRLDVPACQTRADLLAVFHPGQDRSGLVRPLSDDSLRFDAHGLSAAEVRLDGARVYRMLAIEFATGPAAPPLHLRSPAVAGITEPPPQLGIEPLRVPAPDTIVVSRNGMVALPVEGYEGGALGRGVHGEQLVESNGGGFWRLEVQADTAQPANFAMNGRDLPPSGVRFPADLLPVGFKEGTLRFQANVQHGLTSADGGYVVGVGRILRCTVVIRISD